MPGRAGERLLRRLGEPPPGFASRLEYLVYFVLRRLGVREGVDYERQVSFNGGRLARGGLVVDFLFPSRFLAINVQGHYYHYSTTEQLALVAISHASLAAQGYTLIRLDEEDLLESPFYYVREALNLRSHARAL